MSISGIEDLISAALRWVGLEDGDPGADLPKTVSKSDHVVSTFEVSDRSLPETLREAGPRPSHPLFTPYPSASSGDEGGGGGGPYRTPDPVTPVPPAPPPPPSSESPIRDSRDEAPGVDWEFVSRPEYQEYARGFFEGLSYADLRMSLDVFRSQGADGENPAGMLLRELDANLRRCADPARRSGDPLFRLEFLTDAEFRRAVGRVFESHHAFNQFDAYPDGGYAEYTSLLLRRDSLVDALRSLPPSEDSGRAQAYERAIRRLDARLPHVTLYTMMSLRHMFESRLIEPSGDGRLPRRGEATFTTLREQVREMLPESMRGERYESFIARAAMRLQETLGRLPEAERDRLFREELNRRGAVLGGSAPESLVLSLLEEQTATSRFDRASQELLRARIAEIRSSPDNPVTDALTESLRRAGRLVER